ncbi:hypothetical protein KIW84_073248 [Lathyrus oleraceus]|uniref:Uncharacterized protein n=1 Tax=Pisum sativum TaxID=3888 RepID=A0A9D4ZYC5_PEA|nr:hypothetical protein KIW84_073248 [Pisum sativum]
MFPFLNNKATQLTLPTCRLEDNLFGLNLTQVKLIGNKSKLTTRNLVFDFKLIKAFNVNIHHPRSALMKEIIVHSPLLDWIKCNNDGAFVPNLPPTGYGGLFRNRNGDPLLVFVEPLI